MEPECDPVRRRGFGRALAVNVQGKPISRYVKRALRTMSELINRMDQRTYLIIRALMLLSPLLLLFTAHTILYPTERPSTWSFFTTPARFAYNVMSYPAVAAVAFIENLRVVFLGVPEAWTHDKVYPTSEKSQVEPGPSKAMPSEYYDQIVEKILSHEQFKAKMEEFSSAGVAGVLADFVSHIEDTVETSLNKLRSQDVPTANADIDVEERINEMKKYIDEKIDKYTSDNQREKSENEMKDLRKEMSLLKLRIEDLTTSHRSTFEDVQKCCVGKEEIEALTDEKINQLFAKDNTKLKKSVQALTSKFLPQEEFETRLAQWTEWMNRDTKRNVMDTINEAARLKAKEVTEKMLAEYSETFKNQLRAEFQQNNGLHLSTHEIDGIVQEALNKYDADKTGMFDFALESAGGTIASTRCTETYDVSNAVYSVWGVPFWWEKNNPRTILQPGASPGQCWAFKGSDGAVVIKLSGMVNVAAVSLEHIPKILAPDGNIRSAPKDFSVLGLRYIEDPSPICIGNFTYLDNGNPVQTFPIGPEVRDRAFDHIELRIKSNYGNQQYTCLYRFRVHGTYEGTETKH